MKMIMLRTKMSVSILGLVDKGLRPIDELWIYDTQLAFQSLV